MSETIAEKLRNYAKVLEDQGFKDGVNGCEGLRSIADEVEKVENKHSKIQDEYLGVYIENSIFKPAHDAIMEVKKLSLTWRGYIYDKPRMEDEPDYNKGLADGYNRCAYDLDKELKRVR